MLQSQMIFGKLTSGGSSLLRLLEASRAQVPQINSGNLNLQNLRVKNRIAHSENSSILKKRLFFALPRTKN